MSLNPSLSSDCTAALNANLSPLLSACGYTNGPPSIDGLIATSQTLFASSCSTACSSALSTFTTSANTTCGSQLLYLNDADKTTAGDLISEVALISAVGCVKDSSNNYCILGQLQTLTASGLNISGSNFLAALSSYSIQHPEFACSACAKSEIAAAKGLTTLNARWGSQVSVAVNAFDAMCPATTTTATAPTAKSSAQGLFALTLASVLPFLLL
ncbi:hypothetical protein HDV03_001614 [Kappamyces sp. JEL0829]|nr:hypothetical protein HDV03_001614 [Kappamyces sp. JEL0829]